MGNQDNYKSQLGILLKMMKFAPTVYVVPGQSSKMLLCIQVVNDDRSKKIYKIKFSLTIIFSGIILWSFPADIYKCITNINLIYTRLENRLDYKNIIIW